MAVPKRRQSKTRTANRRSHDAIQAKSLVTCSNCDAQILPHRVCPKCGFYKGKRVLTIKVKEKAEQKQKG